MSIITDKHNKSLIDALETTFSKDGSCIHIIITSVKANDKDKICKAHKEKRPIQEFKIRKYPGYCLETMQANCQ